MPADVDPEQLRRSLAGLGLGEPTDLRLTSDEYSLNSISGRVRLDGVQRFFKLHAEEGEADQVSEYYRAHLLADAGLPVEVPLAINSTPGEQVVVYAIVHDPRMVDVCLDIETAEGPAARLPEPLVSARRTLDRTIGEVAVRTLAPARAGSSNTAIHQLFHRRLADPDGRLGGTRFGQFYADNPVWQRFKDLHWTIGGVEYERTLSELADEAADLLAPGKLASLPVVTAHGDDHHGNVWARGWPGEHPRLTLFDPAFAADDIPALLALVKPTYHNALAHPYWLYHPERVESPRHLARDGRVEIEGFELSGLRRSVLDSIVAEAWRPLIQAIESQGELPDDWRRIVRLALFLCPLLVTNLCSDQRSEAAQLVGLAHAVAAGSRPLSGSDDIERALDAMLGT